MIRMGVTSTLTVSVPVPPASVLAVAVMVVLPTLFALSRSSSIETMVLSLDRQLERVTPSMVGSVWVEPYSMEIASDFSSIHLA